MATIFITLKVNAEAMEILVRDKVQLLNIWYYTIYEYYKVHSIQEQRNMTNVNTSKRYVQQPSNRQLKKHLQTCCGFMDAVCSSILRHCWNACTCSILQPTDSWWTITASRHFRTTLYTPKSGCQPILTSLTGNQSLLPFALWKPTTPFTNK